MRWLRQRFPERRLRTTGTTRPPGRIPRKDTRTEVNVALSHQRTGATSLTAGQDTEPTLSEA
jgi:hypothetical protein